MSVTKGFVVKYVWVKLVKVKQAGFLSSPWDLSGLNVLMCFVKLQEKPMYRVFQIDLAPEPFFMKYLLGMRVLWDTLWGNIKGIGNGLLENKLILLH